MSQINIVERLAVSYAAYGKFEKALAYFEQIHEEDQTARRFDARRNYLSSS
jgi:pentatricopeptide repeat protein